MGHYNANLIKECQSRVVIIIMDQIIMIGCYESCDMFQPITVQYFRLERLLFLQPLDQSALPLNCFLHNLRPNCHKLWLITNLCGNLWSKFRLQITNPQLTEEVSFVRPVWAHIRRCLVLQYCSQVGKVIGYKMDVRFIIVIREILHRVTLVAFFFPFCITKHPTRSVWPDGWIIFQNLAICSN